VIPIATIDELLDKVDSKYTLVHLAARRAREINDYYHSLGEGLGQFTPPLVDQVDSNKPLSIALEEIAASKITFHRLDPELESVDGEAAEGDTGEAG
jgi:DNA-directed RNA polymerase subunit omega